MSADNWTDCPRCTAKASERIVDLARQLTEGYGVLPLDEFDALRDEVKRGPQLEETFRENYEFYGAPEGTIVADYSGWCVVCGLKADFKYRHDFWSEHD